MSEPARTPTPTAERPTTAADRLRSDVRDWDATAERSPHRARFALANAEVLHEQVKDAALTPSGRGSTGLLLMHVDDLIAIGERLGPDAADEVRDVVALRISSQLRDGDVVGQLDDETFCVLMKGATDSDLHEIHRRARAALAEPVRVSGVSLFCPVRYGLATASTQLEHAALWRRAHAELSEDPERSATTGAIDLGQPLESLESWARPGPQTDDLHDDLEEALLADDRGGGTPRGHGLNVQYQPIVELATSVTQGFEALIRWQHPTRGLIPAAAVVELAERTDLIVRLGEWVLNRALIDAVALASARSAPKYVSVNVSATQLLQPDFAERTRRHVEAAGLDPSGLVVEITESQIVQDHDHIWDDLADLRELGIQVAIDDYGTGYASLAYLRHPVIDMLKLDRTFLADIQQPRGRTILQSVVALTESLGISLVAEGIEDERTRAMLVDSGCTLGQGHLYAAAMPLSVAMGWGPPPDVVSIQRRGEWAG